MILASMTPRRPRRCWSRLESAVHSHLVSDVPVGAFLSGGVDSERGRRDHGAGRRRARQDLLGSGSAKQAYNELPYGAPGGAVARDGATTSFWWRPQDLEVLDEVLAAVDEPFADVSAIPTTWCPARPAARQVVLSGDGGDELSRAMTAMSSTTGDATWASSSDARARRGAARPQCGSSRRGARENYLYNYVSLAATGANTSTPSHCSRGRGSEIFSSQR